MKRKIFYNIDPSKIGFELIENSNSTPPQKGKGLRIKLYYNYENEKKDLIIAPEGSKFYSSGIQKGTFSDPQDSTNYNIPLNINMDPNTDYYEDNKNFYSLINSIYEKCKDYIFDKRKELGIKINERENMENIFKNPFYKALNSKYEKLMLFPKLMIDKKTNKVWTIFFEENEEENEEGEKQKKYVTWDFNNLINKSMYVYPAIFFDSLYLTKPYSTNAQVSIQYKASQVIFEIKEEKIEPSLISYNKPPQK